MTKEFWKWPESCWTSDTIDWKKAEKITAGVDLGTTSAQAAIMCDGELFGYANLYMGPDFKGMADTVIQHAMGDSGMTLKDIGSIIATGWGADNVSYATGKMDEVHCHMKGGRFMYGKEAHTIVDLGGQTVKAIRVYDWDRVRDVMMNDKCATGMGRNIEMMCDIFQVPIDKIGEMSMDVKADPEPVSTTCWAFANPEAVGLFRDGFREDPYTENDVYAAYLFAIEWRIMGTIAKLQPLDAGDATVYEKLAFTGGMAKNVGITKRLERDLNVTALTTEYDPMLAGAIGAALLA